MRDFFFFFGHFAILWHDFFQSYFVLIKVEMDNNSLVLVLVVVPSVVAENKNKDGTFYSEIYNFRTVHMNKLNSQKPCSSLNWNLKLVKLLSGRRQQKFHTDEVYYADLQ